MLEQDSLGISKLNLSNEVEMTYPQAKQYTPLFAIYVKKNIYKTSEHWAAIKIPLCLLLGIAARYVISLHAFVHTGKALIPPTVKAPFVYR